MSDDEVARVSVGGVSVYVFDIEATSYDDWTGKGTQYIWRTDAARSAELKDQLTALLGEPDAEMLTDSDGIKGLIEAGTRPGMVVLEKQ